MTFMNLSSVAVMLVTALPAIAPLSGQEPLVPAANTNLPPPLPPPPIDFRQLLTMNPAEREKVLATRSESQRQVLQRSLREYDSLPPPQREARLCSVQLRLYLRPLLEAPNSNRLERVAVVPLPDRKLVEDRLKFWDQLPSAVQKEFLTNEWVLRYIFRPETSPASDPRNIPNWLRNKIEKGFEDWNGLPEQKRGEILDNFIRLFQLSEREKTKILNEYTEAERQRMEQTLQRFEQLPQAKRERCITGFQKFADLSPQQREQFLSNAKVWQSMSVEDRMAWRALVSRISAPKPPALPGLSPPLPPPEKARPVAPTNIGVSEVEGAQ